MNVNIYTGSRDQDLLVGQWYQRMIVDGELEQTFTKKASSISSFYRTFQTPNILVFFTDDEGIWMSAWFEPMMDGAFMGLWIRPDMRRTKTAVRTLLWLLDETLKQYCVVMGVTKQQHIVAEHMRLGYNLSGIIPSLYDGDDAYLVVLTQEGLYGSKVWKTSAAREKEKVS